MKTFPLIALPLAVFLASCQKEQSPEAEQNVSGINEFTAFIENCVKTELDSDFDVLWCAGDAISVFDESGTNFKFVTNDSGKTATFSKVTEGEMQGSTFYALYPYYSNATIEDGTITTKTTTSYTMSGSSFTRGSESVMAAKTSGSELHFKNVNALLQFTIPTGVNIKKLYFYAGGKSLSGQMSFSLDNQDIPVVTENPAASDGITVMAEEGSFAAGTYYLPVIPYTYSNLRVQITYNDDKTCTGSEAFTVNQFTAKRNNITKIGTVYDGRSHYKWITFENGTIPACVDKNSNVSYTVEDNPASGKTNDSEKSIKLIQASAGSGYTGISLKNINVNIRKKITGVVFHFKPIGTGDAQKYCPRVQMNGSKHGPKQVGSQIAASEWTGSDYKSKIQLDYWNVLTFKASQFGVDNFETIEYLTIYPFLYSSGNNFDGSASAYIDNIGFCFD